MHVKSITWNDLYTLLETHRNKPHPKSRPEPPAASSTLSHVSAADNPNVHVGQFVIKIKTSRDDFGFSGSRGQSAPSARTVRNLRADGPPFHRGRSAVTIHLPYVILYNSYKNVYSSEKCEINFVGFIMMSRTC
jgi:hypothetical protein